MSGLRQLARDKATLVLLVLLVLLGAFVGWQLSRLGDAEQAPDNTALAAGSRSVTEIIDELAQAPVSRPRLAIQRWQTANGARVLFVPAAELPMLDLRVVFDAGGARDGGVTGTAGLARLTSAMIGEGTATRSADAIARGFESTGAQFAAASYRDMAVVELRTLTAPEMLEPALALFADVLANPAFAADALERRRGQMLIGLQRDEERPATVASRSLMATLYLIHPYATPAEGTVASVKSLRADELRAFHARYYVARNAVVALTGAIDRAQAERIAEQVVGALPAGEPAPELPVPPNAGGGNFHVRFDSQQTHILVGLPALRRADPDEAALLLANQVLGGDGLNSLLADAVRNERGLAYSVGSGFQAMRVEGPFLVSLQTGNDTAGDALAVVRDVLQRFASEGPPAQRLADARRQLVGSYPLRFADNSAIVGTLAMLGFYGLPDDHIEQQLLRIEQLGADEVRAAFNRHVPLQRLLTLTLGPEKPVVPAKVPPPRAGAAPAPSPALHGAPPGDLGP